MANNTAFGPAQLTAENDRYYGTPGCSVGNRALGFRPAFLDRATGVVYLSRFADGRAAPVHVLDGLPQHLVTQRAPDGRVRSVRDSVISGFARDLRFYTRDEALRASEAESDCALAA